MSGLRADLMRHQKQLDALGQRAVIIDAHGCAWQESRNFWYRAFDGDAISSYQLAQNVGRVTVLDEGRKSLRRKPPCTVDRDDSGSTDTPT